MLQRRKSQMRQFLDPKFHFLTRESNPVTCHLFSPDLEQKITESTRLNDVARKIRNRDFVPTCMRPFGSRNKWQRGHFNSFRRGQKVRVHSYFQQGNGNNRGGYSYCRGYFNRGRGSQMRGRPHFHTVRYTRQRGNFRSTH